MKTEEKRKYRGPDFGVNVGASVSPATFSEIEGLAKAFGTTKSRVVRELLVRGLAEYHRDGKLIAQRTMPPDEQATTYHSSVQGSNPI